MLISNRRSAITARAIPMEPRVGMGFEQYMMSSFVEFYRNSCMATPRKLMSLKLVHYSRKIKGYWMRLFVRFKLNRMQ